MNNGFDRMKNNVTIDKIGLNGKNKYDNLIIPIII